MQQNIVMPGGQTAFQEQVAWVWNPIKEAWEKVHAFGYWQQGAIYAFGPSQPAPLAPAAAHVQDIEHCIWARNGNTPCPHTARPASEALVALADENQRLRAEIKFNTPAQKSEPVGCMSWGGSVDWNREIPPFGTDLYVTPQAAESPAGQNAASLEQSRAVAKENKSLRVALEMGVFVNVACDLIKSAQEEANARDYQLDEADCIAALRGISSESRFKDVPYALAQENQRLRALFGQTEYVQAACALIKAADSAAMDGDYMLDSNDCIAVLRGSWKGPLANDMPAKPAALRGS
jgi:hypothetical protein